MDRNKFLVNIQGGGYYIRVNNPIDFKSKLDSLMSAVCLAGGITLGQLKTKSKKREIVICKQIISYIAYKENYGSYKNIGKALGGYNHSTVFHGVEKVTDSLSVKDVYTLRIMKQLTSFHKLKI
jgi:chromosomal replication initiator protein